MKALAWVVALVGMMGARSAGAEITSMPPRIGRFWFNESVKSAERKCDTFTVTYWKGTKKVDEAHCAIAETDYLLSFSRASKLIAISFDINQESYDVCAKEVLDALGPKGRGEDDNGYEHWAIAFFNEQRVRTGGMMCAQTGTGHRIAWWLPD